MKKWITILLAVCMLFAMAACGGDKPAAPAATDAPAATAATEKPAASGAEATQPPYQPYEYAYGSMMIGVPFTLPAEPKDEGESIVFTDPEGQWTMRFQPLSVQSTGLTVKNLAALMDNFRTMGNYQNIETTETEIGGYRTSYFGFEMNPDWVDAEQGYTTSYHEPHALYVVDYGDDVVGEWGGLCIDVAAPERERVPLSAITGDDDVQTLLQYIEFHKSDAMPETSVPGLSVAFPGRWAPGSDGDHTIWAAIRGSTGGSIYFGPSVYADPKEAAGYLNGETKTLTFGGRTWVGGVRSSELSDKTLKSLELFTEFTEYHALYAKLNLNDWSGDGDFWAFAESDQFKAVMESVQTDPAAFHNPEDDLKDKAGFECNNVGEISAYKGTEKAITIPASIGANEIVGINYAVFKGNEDITSVTISEGVVYIEAQAFRDCVNLKTVVLPNSLTLIDNKAFLGCTALESVRFGDNLIEIGESAFEDCGALGDVLLPATVQLIGASAFEDSGSGAGRFACPAEGTVYRHMSLAGAKYDSVEIGPSADLSDYNIMQGYTGRSVTIGEGTEAIGQYFLLDPYATDTMLTGFHMPKSLKEIGDHAFSGRKGMTAFDLTGVERMGEGAFAETGLVEIVIPGTLKDIPANAFDFCQSVERITIGEGVETIGRYAFSSAGCGGKTTDTYNFLSDEEVAQYKDVVHTDASGYVKFVDVMLPSTIREVEDAFLGVRLEGLYLPWLTSVDQLPAEFHPGFDSYECIYVSPETVAAQGSALNDYFSRDEGFVYWCGSVRVFEGRHHYWTDRELGIDA